MAATPPCPVELWPLFSSLLDEALDLPESEREAWLAALEGESVALRPPLARVLAGDVPSATPGLLDRTPLADAGGFAVGSVVGPFRLVRRLGEGGMGEVWLVDRIEEGPRRQLALKLPHAFVLSPAARARFQRERDVLAALVHPHIAQLYEAGVSADNIPYLALEYVDGTPISTWCREKAHSLDGRLALVQTILAALGFAHRRLIVHRDVKPSNVLVTAEGQVKLLDFGIARLLDDASDAGDLTQPAARLATPDYAAPEQLEGDPVTVSTDLFAVGALLFELAAGVRPFSARRRSPGDEAPLASKRADATAAGNPLGARLQRALRGDLDAILAKAMALDPARRYGSADSFARDLACFRAGMPVSARRVGWAGRAAKFARRQPLASTLAAAFVLAVSAGVGGVLWQAERAQRAAERANTTKDFLISVFEANNPRLPRDKPAGESTVKELLDAATPRVEAVFAGEPESKMEILATLSDIYEFLEDVPHAEALEARRVVLARRLYGPDSPITLRAMIDKAWDDAGFLEYTKAKVLLADIRDRVKTVFGPRSHEWAVWLMEWAYALAATPGTREERRRDVSAAADIFASEKPLPDDYPTARSILGKIDLESARFDDALKAFDTVAALDRTIGEFDQVEAMINEVQSAEALRNLGRLDEAERRYRLGAATAERAMGRHSSGRFQALAGLAELLHDRGEREGADGILQQLDSESGKADTPPGKALSVKAIYGEALAAEGRAAAAIPLLNAALVMAKERPNNVADLPRVQQALGEAEDQLRHSAEAGPLFAAARTAWMREGPSGAPWVLGSRERWARFEIELARAETRRGRVPSDPRGGERHVLGAGGARRGRSGAAGAEARRSRRGAGRERGGSEDVSRGDGAIRRQRLGACVANAGRGVCGRKRHPGSQDPYRARQRCGAALRSALSSRPARQDLIIRCPLLPPRSVFVGVEGQSSVSRHQQKGFILNKHLLTACAMLLACATGASADSAWPGKIIGTWKGLSNQSPIVLTVSTQSAGGKCDYISGSIQDVNGGFTGNMEGYYCPSSGAVQLLRYPTGGNVAFQVYDGSVSQANPPQGVRGILMGGSFGQYSQSFGPLGRYSFSLTK